jgi:MHS family proline/betaine transporter-like MFS transporter
MSAGIAEKNSQQCCDNDKVLNMPTNNKIILASTIGTLVEWAEFSFYGYLVYKFSHLFFPTLAAETALVLAFGIFAVSYIARPFGALLFGYMGDKSGRQMAFSASIILMSAATLGIGLLPTFFTIGIAAPILLMLLRFLQGMAVSGEFTGAAVYILEHNKHKPILASSWISTSSAAGMLLGSLFGVIVSLSFMPEWAWRIPFIIGAAGALVGFYIRSKLSETTEYQTLMQENKVEKSPLTTLFKHYKKPMIQTAAIGGFVGIYIYTCNIWWVTHVIEQNYFSPLEARSLAALAQGFVVILTPLLAWKADSINAHKQMLFGIFGCIVAAPLVFWVSSYHSVFLSTIMTVLYALPLAAFTATMFKYFKDIFPANIRYTGQAVSWNIAIALFAGGAPMLAQIFSNLNMSYVAAVYVMFFGSVALLANIKRLK